MTQTYDIYKNLEMAKSLNNIKEWEIKDETLRSSMSKFKNIYENVYFYYKDQTIIENMINDPIIKNAVIEIKNEYAKGSESEPLRNKLIEMGNNKTIQYDIFPASKVTDQLLEAIN